MKSNKYRDLKKVWVNISRKFEPTTGTSKTKLRKIYAMCKLDDVTRDPKEWITEIELFRVDLQNLDVHIDDSEMMTHILSNLPEAYYNIVEILEDNLDDDNDLSPKYREDM